jgi:hypothetical protein
MSSSQSAGHSQSPCAIFATISTRPYLIPFLPFVVKRAERTGGMIEPRVALDFTPHALKSVDVQEPSPSEEVIFSV